MAFMIPRTRCPPIRGAYSLARKTAGPRGSRSGVSWPTGRSIRRFSCGRLTSSAAGSRTRWSRAPGVTSLTLIMKVSPAASQVNPGFHLERARWNRGFIRFRRAGACGPRCWRYPRYWSPVPCLPRC